MAAMVVAVAGVAYFGREPAATRVAELQSRVAAVSPELLGVSAGRRYVDPTVPVTITIPPPRWLVARVRPTTDRVTARQRGRTWQTNPRAE